MKITETKKGIKVEFQSVHEAIAFGIVELAKNDPDFAKELVSAAKGKKPKTNFKLMVKEARANMTPPKNQ